MVKVIFCLEGEVVEENGRNVKTAPFGGEKSTFSWRSGGGGVGSRWSKSAGGRVVAMLNGQGITKWLGSSFQACIGGGEAGGGNVLVRERWQC